jgi:hypothetical protein
MPAFRGSVSIFQIRPVEFKSKCTNTSRLGFPNHMVIANAGKIIQSGSRLRQSIEIFSPKHHHKKSTPLNLLIATRNIHRQNLLKKYLIYISTHRTNSTTPERAKLGEFGKEKARKLRVLFSFLILLQKSFV